MKHLTKAQGILFFYLFDLVLLLLLCASFLPFMHRKRIVVQDTVLLNPSVKEKVCFIELSQNGEDSFFSCNSVKLMKQGGIWLGSSSSGNNEFIWPADMQLVENLLATSSSAMKSYEKSASRKDWGDFGLKEKDAFSLVFYDSSHQPLSSLLFGDEDSLTGRIYVRAASEVTVYEVDAKIIPFLTVDEAFWADPFLYPQCLTGLERGEMELMLRRGKLENIRPREGLPVDYTARIYFGNGAEIIFSIYKKDSSFIIIPTLCPGPAVPEDDRNALASINYRYSISGVTLNNLLEECSLSD